VSPIPSQDLLVIYVHFSRYVEQSPINSDNEAGRLLDFVHLDYLRDERSNWVYRPSTDIKVQSRDAYSNYSFAIIRQFDTYSW